MGNSCSLLAGDVVDKVDDLLNDIGGPVVIVSAANIAAGLKNQSGVRSVHTPEWLPSHSAGKAMRNAGYRPKHPIACINSLAGAVLQCVESEDQPDWVGDKLFVDIAKIAYAATKNIFSISTSDEWKAELTALLDSDGDGDLELDELKQFIEADGVLGANKAVRNALAKAERETARGAKQSDVLATLEPVRRILQQSAERGDSADGLSNDDIKTRSMLSRHLALKDGWRDPAGIKVRPLSSPGDGDLTAITYLSGVPIIKLFTALMGPLIAQLQEFGYEPVRMLRAFPYDWRCPPSKLEERDSYFSNLMDGIEELVRNAGGEKCVLVAHSMGCRVSHYFTHWVATTEPGLARGGRDWLDAHVHSLVPIGGPFLGACSGTMQFLQPGNVAGLVPAVMSTTDGHSVLRSWGSMPFVFGNGDALRNQPASHYSWVRREGALQVEILSLDLGGVPGVTEGVEPYVQLSLCGHEPAAPEATQQLRSEVKEGSQVDLNELFQFCWDHEPEALSGLKLHITVTDELEMALDKTLANATLELSSANGVSEAADVARLLEESGQATLHLQPGTWLPVTAAALGDSGVRLTARVCWIPPSHTPPGYAPALPAGAAGCGGAADEGTTEDKRAAMVAAWGEANGTEWRPEGPYDPCSTDRMFALEDMEDEFRMWQETYANDPIYSQLSTAPPPLKTVLPIYGINKPSVAGAIYRRKVAKWRQGERTCYLTLDEKATVKHPGYKAVAGVVEEQPSKTPQADPTAPSIEEGCARGTKASGDKTVPYQSLRWPVTWRAAGVHVEPVEVEGGDHRGIIGMTPCHFTVLQHTSHPPALELAVRKVQLGRASTHKLTAAGDSLKVRFDWHNANDEPAHRLETDAVGVRQVHLPSAWTSSHQSRAPVPVHSLDAVLACRITLLIQRAKTGALEVFPKTFPVTLTCERLFAAVRLGRPIKLQLFDSDAAVQITARLIEMTPDVRRAISALHALTPDENAEVRVSLLSEGPPAEGQAEGV